MLQKKIGVELFVFFILLCNALQAQQSSIDSLTRLLPTLNDTSRIGALNTIAYKYLAFDPSKAKEVASEALMLSKQNKFAKGESSALLNLGDYEFRQSNYAKSLEYGTQAIKVASQIPDSTLMADAYRLMGNVHTFGFRQYDEALTYQLKALAILKKENDKRKLAALYGSLTWVYSVTNKNLDTAIMLAREGTQIGKMLNDHQLVSYNLNSLGLINYRKQNFDSALYYLFLSNQEGAMVNDEAVQTVNNLTVATIYLAQQKVDQSIQLFKEVLQKSAQINLREIEKDAFEGLSNSYKAKQDFKLALTYHLKFVALRDSLLNWEITQKSLALKATFDEERREAKIIELQYEKQKAHSERNLIFFISAATIAMLLTIIALAVRTSNQKKKANKQLQEKNEEIQTQNEELASSREELTQQTELVNEQNKSLMKLNETKDKLFSIVSHDLRGPISSLRSLLSLVTKGAVTAEEFQTLAPKLNQNVTSVHETLENLLQWSSSQMSGLKFSPALVNAKPLVQTQTNLFYEAAKVKHIEIADETKSEDHFFGDKNHISLILRNLISNAIKFTPDGGSVLITSKQVENRLEISVVDSGIGISTDRLPELFQLKNSVSTTGTHGERGTGLGLSLCHEMAQKNNGALAVKSELNRGTTVTLSLPLSA